MKILLLHCDFIKFKPLKKALKKPEELSAERLKEINVKDDPLVVLTAVEKNDSVDSVKELVKNIEDVASQVKAKNIVLYPYAHLSSNLSSPEIAMKILEEADKELVRKKFKVTRAPFGYYKEFELKVKGHPLSELSRSFGAGKNFDKGGPTHPPDRGGVVNQEKEVDVKNLLRSLGKSTLD